MRLWALLRALAAEGHQVDLFTLAQPQEMAFSTPELRDVCGTVVAVPLEARTWSQHTDYLRRLGGACSLVPYGVGRFRSPEMRERVSEAAASGCYDALVAGTPYSLINVPPGIGIPLIVDDQNIEHMILKRYARQERNPCLRAYAWLEWWKMSRWEAASCARGRLIMVCSHVDRQIMGAMCPHVPVTYVPNIIDIETYTPTVTGAPRRLLYVGGMDWLPNRDAVEFFARSVLPELRLLTADVRFAVAYTADHAPFPEFRRQMADVPELEFVETTDIRAEIARASIFVVPLRIGSGTRFKILEGAATAKAMVSTRVGAEGLNFADGKEILLRDDPRSFAAAVADLLEGTETREKMGLAARDKVEREYSFEALRATLRNSLSVFGSSVEAVGVPVGSHGKDLV
jgi:glycosyltransferase involved in cell wall biosynthesis